MTPDLANEINSGNREVVVYGWIYYKDFRAKREREYFFTGLYNAMAGKFKQHDANEEQENRN